MSTIANLRGTHAERLLEKHQYYYCSCIIASYPDLSLAHIEKHGKVLGMSLQLFLVIIYHSVFCVDVLGYQDFIRKAIV